MQLALVAFVSTFVFACVALFSAIRLALDVRAIGQPSGVWAIAFGFELGFLQLAGVVRAAAPTEVEGRIWGRPLPIGRWLRRRNPRKKAPAAETARRRAGFPAWLDPADTLLFALAECRHVRIETLDIDLDYGFRDVALTGKIAGALYALSGVLPSRVRINQHPSFEGGESWQAHASGRIAFWPGLVLAEVLWYMLRARFRRRPTVPEVEPARGTAA